MYACTHQRWSNRTRVLVLVLVLEYEYFLSTRTCVYFLQDSSVIGPLELFGVFPGN